MTNERDQRIAELQGQLRGSRPRDPQEASDRTAADGKLIDELNGERAARDQAASEEADRREAAREQDRVSRSRSNRGA